MTDIEESHLVQFLVSSEDGDKETVNLRRAVWCYSDDPVLSSNVTKLVNNSQTDLRECYDIFRHKVLRKFYANGLSRSVL